MHCRAPACSSTSRAWARAHSPYPLPLSLPACTAPSPHILCAPRHIRPTAAGCGASARHQRHRHHRHDPQHHPHRHRHRNPQRRQHHDPLREPPARTADAWTRRGWGTQATARTARTLRATARPRRGSTSTTPCMATWPSSTATATAARARACCRSQEGGSERVTQGHEHEPFLLNCVGPSPACCFSSPSDRIIIAATCTSRLLLYHLRLNSLATRTQRTVGEREVLIKVLISFRDGHGYIRAIPRPALA